MATWPSGTKASTSNLDAGTDSPASARADLKTNVDNVNSVIDMFNITSPANNQILKYNSSTNVFDLATDSTVDLTAPGAIGGSTPAAGSFTNLASTGTMTFKQPIEATYDNGNTGAATITPNATNGSVQKYTLTGNITLNAFASPVAGQSMTLFLIQDGTGSRTLTSTMKWSGASKTLSTAANSIDIATIYYDGTSYYASLAKGFA
jgi:hypothetical protein